MSIFGAGLMATKMHKAALHFISPCWIQCWMGNQGGERKTEWVEGSQHNKGLRTVQTSSHQDWRTQQMAPHFFIPEGVRSGICRDSSLRSTGQAITMERTFYPQGSWLFVTISCSSWVFSSSFRMGLCSSVCCPPPYISLLIWSG